MAPSVPLLVYLARADDPHRIPVSAALAGLAQRRDWEFESYIDDLRLGRHFAGDALDARPGLARGSTAAGAGHAEQFMWVALGRQVVALGDPRSSFWPVLDAVGADALARSSDPVDLYAAALDRLDLPCPSRVVVLDDAHQGNGRVRSAAYAFPSVFSGSPALAIDVSARFELRAGLERLGSRRFEGVAVEPARSARFPGGLDHDTDAAARVDSYAALSTWLAAAHAAWGRGVLVGDPDLVAGQMPKACRLRLVPVYGRPQHDALSAIGTTLTAARPPVYGRQFDDRDFAVLARHGQSFQLVDPSPPFDAAQAAAPALPVPAHAPEEPSDDQLRAWASENRILSTVLLWSGMIRELDCLPRLIDVVTDTDLRAGLVLTVEAVQHARRPPLAALGVPFEQGGVLGRLELLLGSTGHGAGFEGLLPAGRLAELLASSMAALDGALPAALVPRGWWPLLDTRLDPRRRPLVVRESSRWPVVRLPPRELPGPSAAGAPVGASASRRPRVQHRDLRGIIGAATRIAGIDRLTEPARPWDAARAADFQPSVAAAVRAAGLRYMFTKAAFGAPRVVHRDGDFVALPFTAGSWDGWTPFYTVGSVAQLDRAERRLLRSGGPGWLAATIDGPLWAMPVEALERGRTLHAMARRVAEGGASGRLVNVTPNVVARYSRILDDDRARTAA